MPQRTFGPFSGTQLTVIIVAAFAFLLPGTLWAVAPFQHVAIQDPATGKRSLIDDGRRLFVYDPINGAAEKPFNFVRFYNGSTAVGCSRMATPPAGKALVVETLAVNTFRATTVGTGRYIYFYVGATCSGLPVLAVNPPGIGLATASLAPGVPVPAGQSLWRNMGSSDIGADITGTGYLVPANWVPTTPTSVTPTGATSESQVSRQRVAAP